MRRISVFPVLILRPVFSVSAAAQPSFSCASCCLWERMLTYTGLYLEGVGQVSLVYDLAGGIFMQLLDDGNILGGKP